MKVWIALLLASPIIFVAVLALVFQPIVTDYPSNLTVWGFAPLYCLWVSILSLFFIVAGFRGQDRRTTIMGLIIVLGGTTFFFVLTSLPPISGVPTLQTYSFTKQSCTDVLNSNHTYVQTCSTGGISSGYFYGAIGIDAIFWLSIVGLVVVGSLDRSAKQLEKFAKRIVCSLYASVILAWPFGFSSGFPIATSVYIPSVCASGNLGEGYWCYGLSGTALVADFLFWFVVALAASLGLGIVFGFVGRTHDSVSFQ